MNSDGTMIGEDFWMCHDELGRIRLSAADSDEMLIELPADLKLTDLQLEAIGEAVLKVQRKAFAAGRVRGLADKSAEIRSVLGIEPNTGN